MRHHRVIKAAPAEGTQESSIDWRANAVLRFYRLTPTVRKKPDKLFTVETQRTQMDNSAIKCWQGEITHM